MIIAVIGNFDPPAHVYALAEAVGKELSQLGGYGGLRRADRGDGGG